MGQTPRVLNYSPLNEIEKHLIFEITCFFNEENQIEKESFQNQSFHCSFATHSSLGIVQSFWLCYVRLFEICICHCLNCCHRCPHLLQSWTPSGVVWRWQRMAACCPLPLGCVGLAGLQRPCPSWWLSQREPGKTPRLTSESAAVLLGHKKKADFIPEDMI